LARFAVGSEHLVRRSYGDAGALIYAVDGMGMVDLP
jgi:hypothetical protein